MVFIEFMFQDFIHFIGVCLVLSGIGTFLERLWNRLLRYLTIRKIGYPPPNCNVDGTASKKGAEVVEISEAT